MCALRAIRRRWSQALNGKVWRKAIERPKLAEYQQRFHVISMRLFAGRTLLHVLAG